MIVFCSWKYYLLSLRSHGLERHICKNEYSNTRLCAVWTTDSAPHYNVSNSTWLRLLLNEKGFILISVIKFWFSFMSIITLFMFILCEIQTQFSCYECDIFLFFQLPYYICTRKLIFSSNKNILRLGQRQIPCRFGMCQSQTHTIYQNEQFHRQ